MKWFFQTLIILIFFWVIKHFQKKKARTNDKYENVLEHGKVFKVFSVIVLLIGIAFLILFPLLGGTPTTIVDWLSYLFILAIFLGLGGVLYFEAFLSKVMFNDYEIRKESLWTRNYSFKWESLTKISHSTLLGWYVIESNNGNKIRISDMMNGLQSFLKEAKSKRPELFDNKA